MTTDMPADLTRVRDHSHDPVVEFNPLGVPAYGTPEWDEAARPAQEMAGELVAAGLVPPLTGWVPPPAEDSAFHTPLCAHRDEITYEHDMDLVADLRRVADEIRAARHATYPHLVTPLKKRRAPKKAAKP